MPALRLSAPWLLTMAGPPVRNGAVLLDSRGRIVAAGPAEAVPAPDGVPGLHLAGAALLPGLVNAHTHLELTGFAEAVDQPEFADWIRAIRRVKAERTPAQFLEAAREGVRRCHAAGVTTIADTGDSGAVIEALHEAGGSGVVYQEVFGPDPAQVEESIAGLGLRLAALGGFRGERVRLGVSPHAPYSVSGPLYRATAALARREGLPMAVHLAESEAETLLVVEGRGPFADGWTRRGIPLPREPAHLADRMPRSPVDWLDGHGVLGPDTLCIHAVRVDPADLELMAERGVAVAHCPISNRRHGHGDAPLADLLDAGLRVGVGTDSELSVGMPDLLAEARAAADLVGGGLDAGRALGLVTRDAAAAIGMAAEVGTLEAGKWGDLVAIGCHPGSDRPEQEVLRSGLSGVLGTWLGGRPVARSPLIG